jgi:ABC-type dipeptide/oligopeptide/nickel transport system permease subunit
MRHSWARFLPALWMTLVVLASAGAPLLWRTSPLQPVADPLLPPSAGAPLGTDALGRDLLARLLYGGRLSLGTSFVAVLLTISVGGMAGMAAAMAGGWPDRLIVWAANSALAIPGLLLALVLVAALGPGIPAIVIAVGLGGAPGFARLARSVFLQAKQGGFVAAATAMGADLPWIAGRHVLPNAQPQLISLMATHYAWALMGVVTLTFLGLGGDPSIPEWGAMLNAGRADLIGAPWAALWPALAISLTVLSVHALADRLGSTTRS